MVRLTSWVMYHSHESPHKDRNTRICVFESERVLNGEIP